MNQKEVLRNYFNIPSSLNNDEVLVYFHLCRSTNFTKDVYEGREKFECFCSKRTLSNDTGMGDKKVLATLKLLEEKGYIKLISKGKPPKTPSKYKMIYAESIKKMEPLEEPLKEPLKEPFKSIEKSSFTSNKEPLEEPLKEPLKEPPSKDISKDKSKYSVNDIEELWKLYPRKTDKKKAFEKIKKLLSEYSKEELVRCIQRYSKEVQGTDKKFILMGSTFFNGRYADYLDSNYNDIKPKEVKSNVDYVDEIMKEMYEKGEF